MAMLEITPAGLYCPAADAYIDPWRGVDRAIITHGHSDHARSGSRNYLTHRLNVPILRERLGDVATQGLEYGESVSLGEVKISLHPAGHVLGSSQVRLEHRGEVWVVSGDYKTQVDPTCATFEPVRCHGFVTEATFALPVYRWSDPNLIAAEIDNWWVQNQEVGRTSVLFAYSLGKAQRVLAMLSQRRGPIFAHGTILRMIEVYRSQGIVLPPVEHATAEAVKAAKGTALVIAPPATEDSAWLRKLGEISTGVASGWMRIRGTRRRRSVDRGFVLSDHADWEGLNQAVRETGAQQIWVTHGSTKVLSKYLCEQGFDARPLETHFAVEGEEIDEATPESAGSVSGQAAT